MPNYLNIRLSLYEHGTIYAHVSRRGPSLKMIVSYLSNAPSDLAEATIALLQSSGSDTATCSWQDEPGERRWVLRRTEDGQHVQLEILRFDETYSSLSDEFGEQVFQAECSLLHLATEVQEQLQKLLNAFREQEYKKRWRYPFPMQSLRQLEAAIQKQQQAKTRR